MVLRLKYQWGRGQAFSDEWAQELVANEPENLVFAGVEAWVAKSPGGNDNENEFIFQFTLTYFTIYILCIKNYSFVQIGGPM